MIRLPGKFYITFFRFYPNITKKVQYDNKILMLRLCDTGHGDYDQLRPPAYQDCHIVLMLFSLVSRQTFKDIKTDWYPEYKKCVKDAQIILVGTKQDLVENP